MWHPVVNWCSGRKVQTKWKVWPTSRLAGEGSGETCESKNTWFFSNLMGKRYVLSKARLAWPWTPTTTWHLSFLACTKNGVDNDIDVAIDLVVDVDIDMTCMYTTSQIRVTSENVLFSLKFPKAHLYKSHWLNILPEKNMRSRPKYNLSLGRNQSMTISSSKDALRQDAQKRCPKPQTIFLAEWVQCPNSWWLLFNSSWWILGLGFFSREQRPQRVPIICICPDICAFSILDKKHLSDICHCR